MDADKTSPSEGQPFEMTGEHYRKFLEAGGVLTLNDYLGFTEETREAVAQIGYAHQVQMLTYQARLIREGPDALPDIMRSIDGGDAKRVQVASAILKPAVDHFRGAAS